jgi:hypothetical protein
VTEVVDETGQEQQRAAANQADQSHVARHEGDHHSRAGDVDGDAAKQGRWLAMPAVLPRLGDHAMRTSPSRNKWRQRGRDAESDSKPCYQQQEIARELDRHQLIAALDRC